MNSPGYEQVKSKFPAHIRLLMDKVKAKIMRELPHATEVPWVKQNTIGYGIGAKKMSEHFCWIGVYSRHIILGFNYGADLPDPEKILEGTGKLFRHFKIRTEADVENPALDRVLKKAIEDIKRRNNDQLSPTDV